MTKGRVVTAVRLAVERHCCHIEGMRDRPSRRILALLLGVFLALGMSLSAVEAGEMGVQMAMASDAGASGQSDCSGCDSGDGSNATACSSVLSCSSAAVLPGDRTSPATKTAVLFVPIFGVAPGLSAPPDPYPPRSLHLG